MSPPLALTSPKRFSSEAASGTLTAEATPCGASIRSDGPTAMTVTGPLVLSKLVDKGWVEDGLFVGAMPARPGRLVPGNPAWLEVPVVAVRGGKGWPSPLPCPAPL